MRLEAATKFNLRGGVIYDVEPLRFSSSVPNHTFAQKLETKKSAIFEVWFETRWMGLEKR